MGQSSPVSLSTDMTASGEVDATRRTRTVTHADGETYLPLICYSLCYIVMWLTEWLALVAQIIYAGVL